MNLLYLTILFPLIGFILLATLRDRIPEGLAAIIGVGAAALSALTTAYVGYEFWQNMSIQTLYVQHLWTWLEVGDLTATFALHLDGLSLLMMAMITGVGFLIHVFAAWYMHGDVGFARFFSYFNLFIASMLILVLGDNLLLLFLGWEGVGLCSYLLIGFYYKNPNNGFAAIKAFTVTRVGDVFLLLAIFFIYLQFNTLDISTINQNAAQLLAINSSAAVWISLLLFLGAAGKSAQIPLQTWLADAMAGPTPVSALIHAATMVTAGVYLISRMFNVFEQAPAILDFVAVVGGITLLVAGFAALVQTDIKRILAYSTMSQLGYMFMAVGAEAYQAGLFHMLAHAFFKALLFLSAGAVIVAVHHEQNIFKMGGLYKKLPFVFVCFIVGGGALAALPFVTVGFFSKDEILWQVWAQGHPYLFWVGVSGAFLTSLYTFRLIWVVFFGEAKTHAEPLRGVAYWLPLAILLVLSTYVGSLLQHPVEQLLSSARIPSFEVASEVILHQKHTIEIYAVSIALAGLLFAILLFVFAQRFLFYTSRSTVGAGVADIWRNAFGFDALYDLVFVKPYLFLTKILAKDPIDNMWLVLPALTRAGNTVLSRRQTGLLRNHADSIGLGMVVFIFILIVIQVWG